MAQDLSLVSFDEIWQELCKRYDGLILCYVQNRDNANEVWQINFYGGRFTCIGLAKACEHKILTEGLLPLPKEPPDIA